MSRTAEDNVNSREAKFGISNRDGSARGRSRDTVHAFDYVELVVGVGGGDVWIVTSNSSSAARVAASTAPVASMPRSFWNSLSAASSSGVHCPVDRSGPVAGELQGRLDGARRDKFVGGSGLALAGESVVQGGACGEIDHAGDRKISVGLESLDRRHCRWAVDAVDLTLEVTGRLQVRLERDGVLVHRGRRIGGLVVGEAAGIGEQVDPCDLERERGRSELLRRFRERRLIRDAFRGGLEVLLGVFTRSTEPAGTVGSDGGGVGEGFAFPPSCPRLRPSPPQARRVPRRAPRSLRLPRRERRGLFSGV